MARFEQYYWVSSQISAGLHVSAFGTSSGRLVLDPSDDRVGIEARRCLCKCQSFAKREVSTIGVRGMVFDIKQLTCLLSPRLPCCNCIAL